MAAPTASYIPSRSYEHSMPKMVITSPCRCPCKYDDFFRETFQTTRLCPRDGVIMERFDIWDLRRTSKIDLKKEKEDYISLISDLITNLNVRPYRLELRLVDIRLALIASKDLPLTTMEQEDYRWVQRLVAQDEKISICAREALLSFEPMLALYDSFGAPEWKEHFNYEVKHLPLPASMGHILASPDPFSPDKTVAETHFPPVLVFGGATFEIMETLGKNPIKGHRVRIVSRNPVAWEQHYQTTALKTHWALIRKELIHGDIPMTWEATKKARLEMHEKRYTPVSGIDLGAVLNAMRVTTGKTHFVSRGTFCSEKVTLGGRKVPLFVQGAEEGHRKGFRVGGKDFDGGLGVQRMLPEV